MLLFIIFGVTKGEHVTYGDLDSLLHSYNISSSRRSRTCTGTFQLGDMKVSPTVAHLEVGEESCLRL